MYQSASNKFCFYAAEALAFFSRLSILFTIVFTVLICFVVKYPEKSKSFWVRPTRVQVLVWLLSRDINQGITQYLSLSFLHGKMGTNNIRLKELLKLNHRNWFVIRIERSRDAW